MPSWYTTRSGSADCLSIFFEDDGTAARDARPDTRPPLV
jgi:hypothetical protein